MAIVQISKIIHRTGATNELPQLDTGEIGFATDERRVFIGNDPVLFPPTGPGFTTQTEILTDGSTIDFSKLSNSDDSSMYLDNVSDGELFVASNVGGVMTWTNRGGDTGGVINLGDVSNVKINGTSFNGAVLQTDGTGNLTWTTNGVLKYDIADISVASEAVVTTTDTHLLATGTMVTILDVDGMTEVAVNGTPYGTSRYWVERITDTTFQLYTDSTLSTPVNSSGWTPATPNTGYVLGTIASYGNSTPGGSSTNVQFNDAGGFLGSNNFTFNKTTNNVAVSGNINVTGNIVADKVKLSSWSLFANVSGLYASDGSNTYSINLTQI